MLHILEALLRKLDAHRYKRNIERALALNRRGEARRDGLNPASARTRLEIEWRARDIHPWDSGRTPPAQRAAVFLQQALHDTEAALYRLFETLPHVDEISLRVFHHTSQHVIISGTVPRPASVARDEKLSIGMRLIYLGLTYQPSDSFVESLEEDTQSAPAVPAFPN
jgi:hypothetical protein